MKIQYFVSFLFSCLIHNRYKSNSVNYETMIILKCKILPITSHLRTVLSVKINVVITDWMLTRCYASSLSEVQAAAARGARVEAMGHPGLLQSLQSLSSAAGVTAGLLQARQEPEPVLSSELNILRKNVGRK